MQGATFREPQSNPVDYCCSVLKESIGAAADVALLVSGLILAAGVFSVVYAMPTGPFFAAAGAVYLTRLGVKVMQIFDSGLMGRLVLQADNLRLNYPGIQPFGLIGALAAACFIPEVGVTMAIAWGIFDGILIGYDTHSHEIASASANEPLRRPPGDIMRQPSLQRQPSIQQQPPQQQQPQQEHLQ